MRWPRLLACAGLCALAVASAWPGASRASGPSTIVSNVVVGGYHTCALSEVGALVCWGRNQEGQLGDGSTVERATPGEVAGLPDEVAAVSLGSQHTCALLTDGGVQCWGLNGSGQLGIGTATGPTPHPVPQTVTGLSDGVSAISAGGFHTCALTTAGGVKCWGSNLHGQIGNGGIGQGSIPTPVDVFGLTSGVVAIAAGDWHTCAIIISGRVKCWGENLNAQIGNGSIGENQPTAAFVCGDGACQTPLSGVKQVAAGGIHTCALTNAGGAHCWGRNWDGQIGDGTTEVRLSPVAITAAGTGLADVAAMGGYQSAHTCTLAPGGAVQCWGRNDYGQVGDGTTLQRSLPVGVSGLGPKPTATPTLTPTKTTTTPPVVQPVGGFARPPLLEGQASARQPSALAEALLVAATLVTVVGVVAALCWARSRRIPD